MSEPTAGIFGSIRRFLDRLLSNEAEPYVVICPACDDDEIVVEPGERAPARFVCSRCGHTWRVPGLNSGGTWGDGAGGSWPLGGHGHGGHGHGGFGGHGGH
jgi:hypothetical protein